MSLQTSRQKIFSKIVSYRVLIFLTITAAVLRVIACQWGLPYGLHPDEKYVVDRAIEMLKNDSFSPLFFNHPDHFAIKVSAILYIVYSFVKGVPLDEFITKNHSDCLLIARLFIAFCGTLLVPVFYAIAEQVKAKSGNFAAFIAAFLPLFVQYSAYATPDMPLTLVFSLFVLVSMKYIRTFSNKHLIWMCVLIGLGVTIKYPAAFMAIPTAILVGYVSYKVKSLKRFFKLSALSFFTSIFSAYVFSPTLFLEFPKVLSALELESRPDHLGADGLGFYGNLLFYAENFFENIGIEFIVFLFIGFYFLFKARYATAQVIHFGWLFLICISCLFLHWERYYLPSLISPIVIGAIGISYTYDNLGKRYFYKLIYFMLLAIIFTNLSLASFIVVQRSVSQQSVFVAKDFCEKSGITRLNSEFEGYTPFLLGIPKKLETPVVDGELVLPDSVQYVLLSERMHLRLYAEPERYKDYVERYDLIKNGMQKIAEFRDYNFETSNLGVVKIYRMYRYFSGLVNQDNLALGDTVSIYKR